MIFNSIEFFVFFGFTSIIYFLIPKRVQKYFLILSSLVFYTYYIPWHVLVLIAIVIINYFGALFIERTQEVKKRLGFWLIILINLSILFIFKYFNFFNTNIIHLAKEIGWNYSLGTLSLILPLGISFFTFKCLSYLIEVYRGSIRSEKNFDVFTLYIIIYPELLSGPIDRSQNLLVQLRQTYGFDYARITNGLKLIAWGYFQKWVIADRLAPLVSFIYDNPHNFKGPAFVFATFLFAIQIYCDFSAYSDIAIGIGEVLGFKFMKNFDRPYFSRSVSEFWRRWHISLSTWFRDYIFLPVAYSVVRRLKNKDFLGISPVSWSYVCASISTMFLVGLWHGASWNFILWGTLIGIYLVLSFSTRKLRKKIIRLIRLNKMKKLHSAISIVFTFSLICLSWIFFRANNLNDAYYIVSHLYTGLFNYTSLMISYVANYSSRKLISSQLSFGLSISDLRVALGALIILFIVQIMQSRISIRNKISASHILIRWSIYLGLILIILLYGRFENRQFIYMQF